MFVCSIEARLEQYQAVMMFVVPVSIGALKDKKMRSKNGMVTFLYARGLKLDAEV